MYAGTYRFLTLHQNSAMSGTLASTDGDRKTKEKRKSLLTFGQFLKNSTIKGNETENKLFKKTNTKS